MCNKLETININWGFYARYIKRPLGFVISLLSLIILLPILLIVGVLIRIKLGSPILFKQKRAGKNEKPFMMYKFRTMTDERNENGDLLPDEVRLTSFGNILRKLSIDELPELWSILKGDMSIIGPRPLYVEYLPYYTQEESLRHAVRGGLTGLAQVNGRALCPMDERLQYDIQYVNNITFIGDIKILFKTISKVVSTEDVGVPTLEDEKRLDEIRAVQRPQFLNFNGK